MNTHGIIFKKPTCKRGHPRNEKNTHFYQYSIRGRLRWVSYCYPCQNIIKAKHRQIERMILKHLRSIKNKESSCQLCRDGYYRNLFTGKHYEHGHGFMGNCTDLFAYIFQDFKL